MDSSIDRLDDLGMRNNDSFREANNIRFNNVNSPNIAEENGSTSPPGEPVLSKDAAVFAIQSPEPTMLDVDEVMLVGVQP